METKKAISSRRSIRKFKNKRVSREKIEELLELAVKAPSGKNKQPWEFIILQQEKKNKLVEILKNKTQKCKENGDDIGSCLESARVMEEAPVIILVYNPDVFLKYKTEDHDYYWWSVDTQSIGGLIQTMLMAATDMGLGTLWICDVFFADIEITEWLNREDELIGAIALGYPDENPEARSRKSISEVTTWLK